MPLSPVAGDLTVPAYYFVVANPDGSVRTARALNSEDASPEGKLAAVQGMKMPVVGVEERLIATVHIVKLGKLPDGPIGVYDSVRPEAVRIASGLVPDEFPAPAPTRPANSTPQPN